MSGSEIKKKKKKGRKEKKQASSTTIFLVKEGKISYHDRLVLFKCFLGGVSSKGKKGR